MSAVEGSWTPCPREKRSGWESGVLNAEVTCKSHLISFIYSVISVTFGHLAEHRPGQRMESTQNWAPLWVWSRYPGGHPRCRGEGTFCSRRVEPPITEQWGHCHSPLWGRPEGPSSKNRVAGLWAGVVDREPHREQGSEISAGRIASDTMAVAMTASELFLCTRWRQSALNTLPTVV